MREIKFRAWDKTNSKMLIDSNLWIHIYPQKNISEDSVANLPDYHTSETPCEIGYDARTDLEVMQFTGLLDKNGKELYEGDIVKCIITSGNRKEPENYIINVEYEDGAFVARYYLGQIHKEIEIIGNIYENPDLIKEI